jgi:hypothetical protein
MGEKDGRAARRATLVNMLAVALRDAVMADVAAVSPFSQSPSVAFIRPDFSSSDDARLGGFVTFGKYFMTFGYFIDM